MDKRLVLLAQVDRLLKQVEEIDTIEATMPQEPTYEEGNTAIVFRKQFTLGGIYYTYCAVGIKMYNHFNDSIIVWYVSGSKTWQEKQVVWADLMKWLMAGEKWEVWQASEYNLLGSSDNA